MMLRKRSKPAQKDQTKVHPLMPDSPAAPGAVTVAPPPKAKAKGTSFFSVPGLFVRFGSKGVSEPDSTQSPTSPLDCKVVTSLGSAFAQSPRSPSIVDGPRRSWDCNNRVGLGIVDSLNDDSGSPAADSKNILFGSQMRINIPSPKTLLDRISTDSSAASPKSLPKNYGNGAGLPPCFRLDPIDPVKKQMTDRELGKAQSCSDIAGSSSFPAGGLLYLNPKSNSEGFSLEPMKSKLGSAPASSVVGVNFEKIPVSLPVSIGPCPGFVGSLSASEIEMSEDYTRITTHGPNPRTTHIFGDCIIGSHTGELPCVVTATPAREVNVPSSGPVKHFEDPLLSLPNSFLSFCHFCKKKLEEGEDIYIYRGEKAFCSCTCREQAILIDEELEKPSLDHPGSPRSYCDEEFFGTGTGGSTN